MKKPSIDRIDNDGDYIFDNCRIIELKENSAKAQQKAILQFDKKGTFLKEWNSISEACKYFNTSVSNISSVLRQTSKSACGYLWRYKNE
jgi:hypothetical protein